ARRQVVMETLRQLDRADLLAAKLELAGEVSRRDLLSRVAAVLAVPMVLSVSTPARAQLASGGSHGPDGANFTLGDLVPRHNRPAGDAPGDFAPRNDSTNTPPGDTVAGDGLPLRNMLDPL